jgi:hypothetical protein
MMIHDPVIDALSGIFRLGIDVVARRVVIDSTIIKLQVWDGFALTYTNNQIQNNNNHNNNNNNNNQNNFNDHQPIYVSQLNNQPATTNNSTGTNNADAALTNDRMALPFHRAHVVAIVFDTSKNSSFEEVDALVKDVRRKTHKE